MGLNMFSCGPDCEKRKPGCHSHCEKYKRERAEYDKRKAAEDKKRELLGYTINIVSRRSNDRAISNKNNARRRWYRSG
jgi:hypothetical protein